MVNNCSTPLTFFRGASKIFPPGCGRSAHPPGGGGVVAGKLPAGRAGAGLGKFCSQGGAVMSREEKIRRRRLEILKILYARPDGRCAYTELAGKLGVSKRTIQLDGQKMCREELVRPCTGGLEITDRGRELCGGFSAPGDGGYLNS